MQIHANGTRNAGERLWRVMGRSFRDQQVFGERPLIVDPLRGAAEAGGASQGNHFWQRVFVAAFGPDGFALDKFNGKLSGVNGHGLAAHGPQVHFNATSLVINSCHVLELRQIEVGIQIAIDTRQQVQIEGGSHAQFVVVRRQQLNTGFLQVGSEQQRISGLKNTSNFAEKLDTRRSVEVADGAAEEQYKKMLARRAVGGHFEQSVEVLALETQDADGLDVAKFAFAHSESGGRNLDGIVRGALAAAKGFEDVASFSAAAATQFGNGNGSGKAVHDVVSVAAQQALIGAREAVLRQMADHFEQGGTHVVVQVFRQQFFLARLREPSADFRGEFVGGVRSDGLSQHIELLPISNQRLTQRNPVYAN